MVTAASRTPEHERSDGAPYGLSTAAVYVDLAKPLAEQPMKVNYEPVRPETGQDFYEAWRQRQADQSRH